MTMPIKRWPFAETPGEFTERLRAAIMEFGDLLPAVRNVLIENPPTLAASDVVLSVRPSEWKELSLEAQTRLNGVMKSPEAIAKMRADRIADGNAREVMARKPLL